jgi:cytochrome P450
MTEVTTAQALFGGHEMSPVADPYAVYRRLRAEEPVKAMTWPLGTTWLVTRYEDVREGLRNDATYSSRVNERSIGLVMGRTIIGMDGREHLRHRNIVTPALAPRALRGDFPKVAATIAHELIDGFAARGEADLVTEFAFTYPLQVFAQILGLPSRDYAELHRQALDLTLVARDPERGFSASRWLADYLTPHLVERESDPTGDLMSRLVHATVDGARLTREEVVSFLRLLVIAGAETTYHLIGSTLYGLFTTEGELDAVRNDPGRIDDVLEEGLRWEAPVQILMREVLEPVEIAGQPIGAGECVTLSIGSANRDERFFADPDRFDPDRRDETEHLSFGFGKHYCAGSRLAKLEANVGLAALLERLPNLRLDRSQPCSIVGLGLRGPNQLRVRFDSTPARVSA